LGVALFTGGRVDRIEIEILKWGKYNKRPDIKRPWWMAISNTITEDVDFFSFTHGEFKVWIHILGAASKKCSGKISIDPAYIEHFCRVKKAETLSAIDKLLKLGVISKSVRDPYAIRTEPVRDPYATLQDKTGQDRESGTEQPVSGSKLPPLAEIWNAEIRKPLAGVKSASKARRRMAEARWAENPQPEFWVEVIHRLNRSSFCRGENSRGWKADFDFLIKPDSASRILEGKYDDRGASNSPRMQVVSPEEIQEQYDGTR
jgi:ribosomal protein L19E